MEENFPTVKHSAHFFVVFCVQLLNKWQWGVAPNDYVITQSTKEDYSIYRTVY